MPLSSKERAKFRAQAHQLSAAVHVGHQGLTEALRQSVDDVLRTQELVKIQFTRTADADTKESANELAKALDADVVQVIGRTATIYRKKPEVI